MRPLSRATTLLTFFALCTLSARAIPKLTRTGRYIYDGSGHRFYIKGIAYQEQGAVLESDDNNFGEPSSFIDPLSLGDACRRDLPYLQQLGVNTIRVYSVNSTLNHDECMNLFSDNGIYTIIDLALPLNGSIDREVPSWSTNLLDQYINTIDAFSRYDNVLAYNVGNEVVVSDQIHPAPFVKAAARDIKAYLRSKNSDILIGYAAINGASNFRTTLAEYLSCDADANAIDLYGLNDYSWCGESTFEDSYSGVTTEFADYNVVAYFSEFGCITSPPRLWTEAVALLSSDMSNVWSGGIAFSYFPASSVQGQFGMVTISEDGTTVTTSDDFDRLVTQYGLANPPNTPAQSSAAASTYPACPVESTDFPASNTLPATPNEPACDCLFSTLTCQFRPATNNYSTIAGELTDIGCSLLGGAGGSCADIGANGETGVYGRVSGCDPTIKLSFVMSQYYEAESRNPAACNFNGNATINNSAPSTVTEANAAASSCLANPGAIFTPSPPANPPSNGGGNGGNGGNGGSSGGNQGAATSLQGQAIAGLAFMTIVTVISGFFTVF